MWVLSQLQLDRGGNFSISSLFDCRDGVSEGQFYQVLLYELDAIRKACASLEPDYQPPVTFVVVQKRHHTRLFASNHNDNRTTDRSGNILPGMEQNVCAGFPVFYMM